MTTLTAKTGGNWNATRAGTNNLSQGGTFNAWDAGAGAGANGDLEVIASADDADYGYVNNNTNYTDAQPATGAYDLENMPADFATMNTLSVQLRYRWSATDPDVTWPRLAARVVSSDGNTCLAGANSSGAFEDVATNITDTTETNSSSTSFTYVDTTADKTAWDGAVLEILITRSRVKGGGTDEQRVTAGEVTGDYDVASGDVNVNATSVSLTLTEQPADVNLDVSVAAGVDALTLTENAADVNLDVSVSAGVDTLTLSTFGASIKADTSISAGVDSLTLTENAADVNLNVSVSGTLDALTLTTFGATVNAETNVLAGVDALTLTANAATVNAETNVQANTDSLTLTPLAATVDVGGDVNVAAGAVALTLTELGATVNAETNVQASAASLSLTALSATVTIEAGEEEVDVGDLGPSAGATVLNRRQPRMGGGFSWERFEQIMAELEAKDQALADKAVKVKSQPKRKKIEETAAKVTAATLLATPAVSPELERLRRTVALAAEAKRVDTMMRRLDAVDRAARALQDAITDEEEVEMLLLAA